MERKVLQLRYTTGCYQLLWICELHLFKAPVDKLLREEFIEE